MPKKDSQRRKERRHYLKQLKKRLPTSEFEVVKKQFREENKNIVRRSLFLLLSDGFWRFCDICFALRLSQLKNTPFNIKHFPKYSFKFALKQRRNQKSETQNFQKPRFS